MPKRDLIASTFCRNQFKLIKVGKVLELLRTIPSQS